ncbi:autotransporter domain-containing protein [Bacillus sp. NP157]|nr:autotransporter domain-containing protein [Bacillus sp. NP157]
MNRSTTRLCARRALAAAIAVAIALPASALATAALPTGPVASTGNPTFVFDGDSLVMNQPDAAAEVDWTSFSIGPGGSVVFNVPAGGTSVHHDLSGQASLLDGTWQGSGDVTLENSQAILLGGSYGAPGGTLRLHAGQGLGIAPDAAIDVHATGAAQGGDVWLQSDAYLEVAGRVDVSAATPALAGTLHVTAGGPLSTLDVVDSVTPHLLADGTHDASNADSQIAGSTLSAAGGTLDIRSGGALWVKGSVNAAADASFAAHDVLWVQAPLAAVGNIALSSDRSVNTGSAGSLSTSGDISLAGQSIQAQGAINADRLSLHATDVAGAFFGPGGVVANTVTGDVQGPLGFSGGNNHIGSFDHLSAGDFFLNNAQDSHLGNVVLSGRLFLDSADHDVDATAAGNVFGNIGGRVRDLSVASTAAITLGQLTARNVTATSADLVTLGSNLVVNGDLSVTAGAGVGMDLVSGVTVGGDLTIDAGASTINLAPGSTEYALQSNSVGGTVNLKGDIVSYAAAPVATRLGTITTTSFLGLWGRGDFAAWGYTVLGDVVSLTTEVHDSQLTIGDGGTHGSMSGNLWSDGSVFFNRSDRTVFAGDISGSGRVTQSGKGTLVLDGHGSNELGVRVARGTLLVGDAAHGTALQDGPVSVGAYATLGGSGRIAGAVSVESFGNLAPGDGIGTLRVGSLLMQDQSQLQLDVGAPGANFATPGHADAVQVDGDVRFEGDVALSVTNAGNMGAGLYRILSWGGQLDESAGQLYLAAQPAGTQMWLATDLANKRMDLYDTQGLTLQFWNANGLAHGAVHGGGSGTWTNISPTWTDAQGTVTLGMSPNPGFAIFAGAPGTVTVDASQYAGIITQGMQFASDGYVVKGDPLMFDLAGPGSTTIRVGDGSAAGRSMTATIESQLQGYGSLVKADEGTLVLTAANTYTGPTMVTGGTLAVADDAALGQAGTDLYLVNGGALRVDGTTYQGTRRHIFFTLDGQPGPGGGIDVSDPSNTFTLDTDNVTGTGLPLAKGGDGTLAIVGQQGWHGPLTVSAGTVRGDALTIEGDIHDDATVVFDQAFNRNTLGATSGSGLFVKTGNGILGFDGQSGFTGVTQVQAGGLEVGSFTPGSGPTGALGGDVQVAAGARLSGAGTVLGNVATHGYIVPGFQMAYALPGTLTVKGNVDFASDSTLMISGTDSSASRLAVGGHVSIAQGARLVVDAQAAAWVAGQKYDVLTAAGGVTGTFASINGNFAFLNLLVAYSDTGSISFILQRNAAALEEAAATPNQRAVAVAAGALGAGHAVYDRLVTLDAVAARSAFNSLSGEVHAAAKGVVMDSQRQVRDAVNRHLLDGDLPGSGRADDGHVSTWLSVLGREADYDGNANAAKVDASGSGVLLGADLAVGDDGRVGALLGHAQEHVHERGAGGSADVRSNHFGLYGDLRMDRVRLSGGVVQAHHGIDTRRDVDLGADSARTYASRDANTTQGFVELGYAPASGQYFSAEPFVQAAMVHWDGDRATERGGLGALVVGSDDARATTGRLGAHLGSGIDDGGMYSLQATVAWQRAWGDTTPQARMRLAEGGPAFTVSGAPLARSAGILEAGMVVRLAPTLRLDASYTGQFAGRASDHGGRLSLNMTF